MSTSQSAIGIYQDTMIKDTSDANRQKDQIMTHNYFMNSEGK